MRVYVLTAGAQRMETLPLGGSLHSGDRFAVRVEVDRPVYVYLAHTPAVGAAGELLAPEQRIEPGTAGHLPAGQKWFVADDMPEQDVLSLLASARPLARAEVLRQVKERPQQPLERGRDDAPPDMREGNRGDRVWGRLDPRGATILRFWLRHE